ncbi:MAG: EI24 domain-containing protein [Synechococcales cyanobacterium M58_A2018_015]|nr:EI24 domain-containing protein [Synechococcales cyanobacterium M58_A2018_015]
MMSEPPPSSPARQRGPVSLFLGTTYPLRALQVLIATPRLQKYVWLPILLNLVLGITLYASLLTAGWSAIDALVAKLTTWVAQGPQIGTGWTTLFQWNVSWWPLPDWHLPNWSIALPNWLPSANWFPFQWPPVHLPQISWPKINLPPVAVPNWLWNLPDVGLAMVIGLLRIVLVISLLLITGFVLLQFGVLLGSPWYGRLSEELEKLQTGQLQTIPVNPIQEIWRALLYELKKLALTIGLGVPLLLCHFLPGLGTLIATGGGIALAATIVCLDFLDSALERRRLQFRQKLGLIGRSLPASAGFGLVCLGLVSIPLLNLLAIPVCVAAGTLFACERILPLLPATYPPSHRKGHR